MKTCPKCKESKPFEDFGKNKSRKDGLQTQCNVCRKETNADYYKKTPERNPQRLAARHAARERNEEFVFKYLTTQKCVDCGEADVLVLEFDHVRGEKIAPISQMVNRGYSIETIEAEIAKCEVRCSNDHRRVTWSRQPSHWKQKYLGLVTQLAE